MKQNTTKQKINHYLLTWIASYLLILALPIVLGAVVYSQAVRQLSEEVEKVNQKSLAEMRLVLDATATELDRVSTNIALSETVSTLASRSGIRSGSDLLIAQSVQRQFYNYMLSNQNIESMGVYFHKARYLLTNRGSHRSDDGPEQLLSDSFGLTVEDWAAMLSQPGNNTWHMRRDASGAPKAYVLLDMAGGVLARSGDVTCILSVNVAGQFGTSMQNTAWITSGDVWLVDDGGGYLTTVRPSALPEEIYDEAVHIRLEEPSHAHSGWRYVALSSRAVIYEKVAYIRRLIYLHLGVCVLLGSFMAYFLARHYYDPISRISRLLAAHGEYAEDEVGTGSNQITAIQRSLTVLLDRYQTGQNILDRQQSELELQRLHGLLDGSSTRSAADWLPDIFPEELFLLVGFYVQDFSHLFHREKAPEPEDVRLINLIITNITEEILGEQRTVRTIEFSGLMVGIVNFGTGEIPGVYRSVKGDSRRILAAFTDLFGLDVSVAVSCWRQGPEELPAAFAEVQELVEYIHLVGEEQVVVFYHEQGEPSRHSYLAMYTMTQEQKAFCGCVGRGDYAGAIQYLDNLFSSDNQPSVRLMTMRVFVVFSAFVDALNRSGVPRETLDGLLRSAQAQDVQSPAKLREIMDGVLSQLCSGAEGGERETVAELVSRVEKYVSDNYADPDLGVSGIAEAFRINPSQLSRTFKKHRGVGLLEYIHSVRIAHINLLLAGDMTIKDIALRTGYLGSLSMIRVYKRYEGLTPGKYREHLRESGFTP